MLREIAYYVLDDATIIDLFTQSANILRDYVLNDQTAISERLSIALEIYQSISKFLGDDSDLRNSLLIKLLQPFPSSVKVDSHQLNAILDFIAHNLESMGVSAFTSVLKGKVNFQGFLNWLIKI